jgi:replicative DNA helicase
MKIYSKESEMAVLGAILNDKRSYYSIAGILTRPEHFFFKEHQEIYVACISLLDEDSKPLDLIRLTTKLRGKKIDPVYIVELSQTVHYGGNIEPHARIIIEYFIKRNCIEVANKVLKMAEKDDCDSFDLVDEIGKSLTSSLQTTSNSVIKSAKQLLEEFKGNVRNSIKSLGIVGVPTGLEDLDALLAGFQRSKVYLFAGRPGMGKTAFGLFLIYCFAKQKKRMLIFSLEMPAREVYARLVSMELSLTGQQVNRGIRRLNDDGDMDMFTEEDIEYYLSKLDNSEVLNSDWINVDDTAGLDINDQRAKVLVFKNQFPDLEGVLSDYIGLKRDRTVKGTRENELSSISMKGKAVAKEADVIWIELAQLNRAVETRGGDKRPQLSDLRDSGSLEQDADLVGFLYRPEYYKIEQDDAGNNVKNMTELIISKHRGGPCDSVWLRSYMSTYTYKNVSNIIDVEYTEIKRDLPPSQDIMKIKNISGASSFETPF